MNITVLNDVNWRFSLNGTCPFEGDKSVFMIVGEPFIEAVDNQHLVAAAMRCQGCLRFILGIAVKKGPGVWEYLAHFPVGEPDDTVDKHVPPSIASDFSEALRCFAVGSYKATVAMCRRSVEASCKEKKAQGKNLKEKIDNLAAQGMITDPLKRMAHRVRLTANEELHGQPDDLDTFTEPEAAGIIKFVREYFHHVYVMPALLDAYEQPQGEAADRA